MYCNVTYKCVLCLQLHTFLYIFLCAWCIRNSCCKMMEEKHGAKLHGMHTTIVLISRRFAELQGQNVIPSVLRVHLQIKEYCLKTKMYVLKWLGYLSRYSDWLCPGRSVDQILVGVSYTMGAVYFFGVKWLGRVVDNRPPSNAKVKERVQLYLFSPSGPSQPVRG